MARSFPEKTQVVVEHFQGLFKEPDGCPIAEILEVLDIFPRAISEEMNEELSKDILEEEIKQVLQYFQKGKSLGPNGFTLGFFRGFYDLIKGDILEWSRSLEIMVRCWGASTPLSSL